MSPSPVWKTLARLRALRAAARSMPPVLTPGDLAAGRHRQLVGGRWEEIGRLQLHFMVRQGLAPEDRLLDVGCGALRAGLHFIRYLEPGCYHGIDSSAALLEGGGRFELERAGLLDRSPRLLVNGEFEFERFGCRFRYALANSVFTHLPLDSIERCLVRVAGTLEPGGRFFASYFAAPAAPHHREPRLHPDGIVSHADRDPYHHHVSAFRHLVEGLPLDVQDLGHWGHPRGLSMLVFTRVPGVGR